MFTRVYWVERYDNGGAIGIMARPRGNEWLIDEINRLKQTDVKVVVSLLEKEEIQELGLRDEEKLCKEKKMDFINFPIKDRAVPTDKVAVENLIKLLDNKVCNGEKIVIHCRMGIGRSSLIAGAVLIAKGLDPDKVIEKITIIRELKVPDTEEQILWLRKLKKDLQ